MFKKILIANRGEIALRVIRACREMKITSVAVFSDADRNALHVREADEAYYIGQSTSSSSYLVAEKHIEKAKLSGAEAIHPGYGFLAENSDFARLCSESGIVFIGPFPDALDTMGNKITARKKAREVGVPLVPGLETSPSNRDEALAIAGEIGFPVMIKAAAGGGGKGMRIVTSADELWGAIRTAGDEARSAFGDPTLYFEKYLSKPRHIEVQIVADRHGNIIYLGERECSIQRRHQKLIEESPSPIVDECMRRSMGEAAVRLAKSAGYDNAGTVEFLVDGDRNFYFLEMNTRLQVEHPVTEMVTGIDLVKEQINVAAGELLSVKQEDVLIRGSAIECRISAENPLDSFYPSSGVIERVIEPGGPGVRVDSGISEGIEVSLFYDPLIAKLITWGRDRKEAILRMQRALAEYIIMGIQTTIPFHKEVLGDDDFQRGDFNTGYVAEKFSFCDTGGDEERYLVAALAASIVEHRERGKGRFNVSSTRGSSGSAWKLSGRPGYRRM